MLFSWPCLWITIVYFFQGILSQSPCTLPSNFQNSVWADSDKGELVFNTDNMTGWDFEYPGLRTDIIEEWECYYTGTVGSKLYLIMRCKQNVTINGDFTPYLCMELTEVSSNLYYYYLLWAEQSNYQNERITTRSATSIFTDVVQDLCLDNTNPAHTSIYPETSEYHVLVKKGNEIDAKQECPSTFFGEYSYTVTDIATGTEYCGNGDEIWDVCTDYSHMAFNYSICNTQISYSANGSVFCLVSITSGGYVYHTVYNEDNTVDVSSNTYRFTCFMSEIASDGSLNVSQTPGSCKKGQTPNDQPVFASNSSVAGLNMKLTPRILCPKTSNGDSGGLSTGAIVGIVFGILIFIAAIILIILICKKLKCRRCCRENKRKKDKMPVTSPRSKKLSVDIDDLPHQLSPHWSHGPHATAPIETKFSGDHTISKSPTLDHKYNPFSVPPLVKGKNREGEEMPNGISRSPDYPRESVKSSKESPLLEQSQAKPKIHIPEKKETRTVSKSIQTEKLFIEDLDKPGNHENAFLSSSKIYDKPDEKRKAITQNAAKDSLPIQITPDNFQFLPLSNNGVISRNSNVTPKAVVLESIDSKTNTPDIKNLKMQPSLSLTDTRTTEIPNRKDRSSKKPKPETEKSLPNNQEIIKTHFKREELKNNATFSQAPKSPIPVPDNERTFKGRKKNKVTSKSQTKTVVKENTKKPKKSKETFFKIKNKSNKRGQQAFTSLIGSKSTDVNRNKKGTFYNEDIPIAAETESYLNISESRHNNSGICYDEENEKARALGYWSNNDTLETTVYDSENQAERFGGDAKELKLALGTSEDRSISRLTLSTDISVRGSVGTTSLSAITGRIDSRGAQYFIENESSAIAIHVKTIDVPDDLEYIENVNGDTETSEHNQEEEDDEYEDEDEDGEDFDETEEAKDKEDVQTSMSVLYGPINEGDEEDEDPDRMVLRGYEPDLLTIKE